MIRAQIIPPNTCFDDPASRLDPPTQDETLAIGLAGESLHRVFEWSMHGNTAQRSLRFHLVTLSLFPQLLPCSRPSVAWCASTHGVSREWARRLRRDFNVEFDAKLRFRSHHFSRIK